MSTHDSLNHSSIESWIKSRTGIVTLAVIAILGFLIYSGHSAHLLGFLPYLLLFACPLMHLFMHGKHGGHRHSLTDKTNGADRGDQS